MAVDKHGNFHMNPQVARMHDGAPPMAKRADPGKQEAQGGEEGHVELHRGPAPDGKGKFHTIHHPSGEVRPHETLHDAHHAINDHFSEDGCKGNGNCEHSAGGDTEDGADNSSEEDYE